MPPGKVANRAALRRSCAVQNERLGQMLLDLQEQGVVVRTDQGWMRTAQP